MPTLFVAVKLAAALGATMKDLLGEVESDVERAEPPATPTRRPPSRRDGGGRVKQ